VPHLHDQCSASLTFTIKCLTFEHKCLSPLRPMQLFNQTSTSASHLHDQCSASLTFTPNAALQLNKHKCLSPSRPMQLFMYQAKSMPQSQTMLPGPAADVSALLQKDGHRNAFAQGWCTAHLLFCCKRLLLCPLRKATAAENIPISFLTYFLPVFGIMVLKVKPKFRGARTRSKV